MHRLYMRLRCNKKTAKSLHHPLSSWQSNKTAPHSQLLIMRGTDTRLTESSFYDCHIFWRKKQTKQKYWLMTTTVLLCLHLNCLIAEKVTHDKVNFTPTPTNCDWAGYRHSHLYLHSVSSCSRDYLYCVLVSRLHSLVILIYRFFCVSCLTAEQVLKVIL